MKNFIKIFLILFCFFVSLRTTEHSDTYLSVQISNILNTAAVEKQPVQNDEIVLKINENENSIVSSNTQSHEISASQDKQNLYSNSQTDRISYQTKFLDHTFINKYIQLGNSKSHKISPYLRNEICTRAP